MNLALDMKASEGQNKDSHWQDVNTDIQRTLCNTSSGVMKKTSKACNHWFGQQHKHKDCEGTSKKDQWINLNILKSNIIIKIVLIVQTKKIWWIYTKQESLKLAFSCLFTYFFKEMQRVIKAVQQLLKTTSQNNQSPLYWVKKVFLGDPIAIPESDLPSIAIQPVWTSYAMRWSRTDQKTHILEIRLIYNAKSYFNNQLWTPIAITGASWTAWQVTFQTSTDHGLQVWKTVQIDGVKPEWMNGAFFVSSVGSSSSFSVPSAIDPGSFVLWWFVMSSDPESIPLVEDTLLQVEWNDLFHSTAPLTVCGTIQQHSGLPFTDANGTLNTSELAQIVSVNYQMSQERWFPTWETIITVQAICIGDR